jgi:hypothetical protein
MDIQDIEGKKAVDYIVNIEDEDIQQEVLQMLELSGSESKPTKCNKKTILTILLGVQTFFCAIYIYPLLIAFYGSNFQVMIGCILCCISWVSFALLIRRDPGKLVSDCNVSFTVSA